jgi:hypothetical protein
VVYQIELANSHLMPSLLEIAVAFVEMLDSSFGFEPVQPKTDEAHSKWQHFLLQWYLWVCHKTQPFMLEKMTSFWRLFHFCYPFWLSSLQEQRLISRKKGLFYIS